MDSTPQLEIISEGFIKPSSPTPPSLRRYKLSSKDQLMSNLYVPLALFYPTTTYGCDCPGGGGQMQTTSELLQIALSKTLTYYYPFAGRLMSNVFIECNDAGVQFIEARIKSPMSEIVKRGSNSDAKDMVFPHFIFTSISADGCLVAIQLSYFSCGGMAVSVCISHKLADASTMSTFINDWAASARRLSHFPAPQFNGASLFPPMDDPALLTKISASPKRENCVTRRYLFSSTKIAELKAMAAANSGVDNPTRVEVVSALLYRCAMSAFRAKTGTFHPSALLNAANIRPMTNPPLPKNCAGNFVTFFPISVTREEDLKFNVLVSKLRNAKIRLHDECKEELSGTTIEEENEGITRNSIDFYYRSSWCRFPLYDVDFGWGRSSLVCCAHKGGAKNTFLLLDTKKGDGIEVFVTLEELEMPLFEGNQELLSFASLDA